MSLNLKNLDVLKQRLAKAPVLADVYTYFLDHFGENDAFFDLGKRGSDPLLEGIMSAIGEHLYGPRAVVGDFLLVHLDEHHFIHGACRMNGRRASVLYFTDIQMGLAVIPSPKPGGQTQFSRFSGRQAPPGYVGSDN